MYVIYTTKIKSKQILLILDLKINQYNLDKYQKIIIRYLFNNLYNIKLLEKFILLLKYEV